jgi:hypothetical protein
MSSNVGPADADRFGWPQGEEQGGAAVSLAAARIARILTRTPARFVGLLPVDDRLGQPDKLAPILFAVAQALTGFLTGEVAIVDAWRTWPWGEARSPGEAATARFRQLAPRVFEISPPPCADAPAASLALRDALEGAPPVVERVLVNLAGYTHPGVVPAATDWLDRVVLLVAGRRSRRGAVLALAGAIQPEKSLGAILIG